jgi:hypothetical protein
MCRENHDVPSFLEQVIRRLLVGMVVMGLLMLLSPFLGAFLGGGLTGAGVLLLRKSWTS